MSWSDRTYYDHGPGSFGGGSRPKGLFWILGVTLFVQIVAWSLTGGARDMNSIAWGAISPDTLLKFQIWRPITYVFLHGSVGHLFWNMVILYFMGVILESHMGTRTFVKMYLVFGAVSGLAVLLDPTTPPSTPTVGASGAIMGLVAFFGTRFPFMPVRFMFLINMQAWVLAAILVGLDLLSILANRGAGGTAHSVHLGGALCGAFYGFLWPKVEVRLIARRKQVERNQMIKERRREEEDHLELDRILQKIKDEGGMHQLSERERKFLLAQSEKLKNQK